MAKDFNRDKINQFLDSANLPGNKEDYKKAVNSDSVDKVLKNLKPSDAAKLQQVLSDKAAAEKLLATPQAQQLLKKLLGDK